MAKIVVAHINTESMEIDLGKLKNDKVAWMVLLKDDGSLQHFFPNPKLIYEMEKYNEETNDIIPDPKTFRINNEDLNHIHITKLRNESYENAKRLIDECMVEELQMLLNEIWDGNAQKWIDNPDVHNTLGHEFVMDYGFTRNQIKWIRHMLHILQGNDSYCDNCRYIAWVIDKETKDKIGGACGHPVFVLNNHGRTTFTGIPYSKPDWCAGKEDILSEKEEKLSPKEQKFLDDTMEIVDQNKDLEIAMSKIGHNGEDDGGCGALIGQEVTDYLEGNCPYTHQKCDYWQEISKGDWECVLPDNTPPDKDPVCPHSKRSKQ